MKQHTIVVLVGPSCCGKSTFAKKLSEAAKEENLKTVIVSSDEIRRELLCDSTLSKMDASMLEVSSFAFTTLSQKVKFHSSYPVNTDLIIVDSTALSEQFRNEMIQISQTNNYNIELFVFDYPRSDLENFVITGDGDSFVTGRHMKKLREEVLPSLNRKAYGSVKVFKKPEEALAWEPIFENLNAYVYASENDKIVVIGDVHECVDELNELLEKLPADTKHVALLGDIIDKGYNTEVMIHRVWELFENFIKMGIGFHVIKGNHERYVYKRLHNMIPANEKLDNEYFQSYKVFNENPQLKSMFTKLYEQVLVENLKFFRGKEKSIILTHAPCSNLYLGKHDSKSLGKQINFYFTSRDQEKMRDELSFVENEANANHPWHLFGHVAHDGRVPKQIKNKIFMDTGCVHGGKLSAAIFNGRHVDFVSVNSSKEVKGLISLEKKETKLEKIIRSEVKLSDEDQKMVNRVIKGGAKFVSGTMAPAPSKELNIESLEAGLDHFKGKVDKVVLQPKYMGSRCQIYMYKDRTKNFATSRNGFRIRIPGIEEFISKLQNWYEGFLYINFEDELIVDGELLPWAALGKGLIDGEFNQYHQAVSSVMGDLDTDEIFQGFAIGQKLDTKSKIGDIERFKIQLSLYGQDRPMSYEAFDILLVDGKIPTGNNSEKFEKFGYNPVQILDFSDPDYPLIAETYYNTLAFDMGFEGIVIKPLVYDGSTVPYMKVRNTEYLRLVYGFDYASRLPELCKQKTTTRKAQLSIDEYELGQAMLVETNEEKRNHLISAMFGKISQEKNLDPRL